MQIAYVDCRFRPWSGDVMVIIATRNLSLRDGDEIVPIPVRIFAPEREKSGSWSCRYEIDWPDKKKKMTAGGYDSVQALLVALQMIGSELYTTNYHKAGNLFWGKPGDGYGFPVAPSIRDLLQGDDAKYL